MVAANELVSIITPAYKAAKVVGETIRSVQAQTYGNWEMLITDDCSPDDTCAAVEAAAAGDARVVLIRQAVNGGPAAARNASLAAARGRWIAFLDSDDLWLPEKLSTQLAFQIATGAALTYTEFRRISADGATLGERVRIPEQLSYSQLLGNTAIATSTVLVDTAQTGPLRMKKTYYDDFTCWLEILRPGRIARGLREDLMRYRVMGGSVSRNKGRSAREVWKTYRDIEQLSLPRACWSFGNYALRGVLKYRRF